MKYLNCVLAVFLLGLTSGVFAAKPNIIVILADDLGYGDVSCYNPGSKIITPNIDALAKEGMRFSAAHSPDAVCTPTRYGMLTGRYCWRTKGNVAPEIELVRSVINGYWMPLIERKRMTIASMLRDNGYATALVGKWHLGLEYTRANPSKPQNSSKSLWPPKSAINIDFTKPLTFGPRGHGFTFSFHMPSGVSSPAFFVRNDTIIDSNITWQTSWKGHAAEGFTEVGAHPRYIEETLGWLRRTHETNPDKPFFLTFTPSIPHLPHVPTQEFKDKIKAQVGKDWDYGAFILQLDDMVGKIMRLIDTLGVANNTLLIFTSDNGPEKQSCKYIADYNHYSSGDLRGMKRDTWEGGHRVPFVARWPGKIPADTVSDESVCLTDFMATFAAIIGYELPTTTGEDSYSILPVLLGKPFDRPIRPATVVHSMGNGYAIVTNEWSYIDGKGSNGGNSYPVSGCPFTSANAKKSSDPPGQLYDLVTDLSQVKNLYTAHVKDTVKALKALLLKYRDTLKRSAPEIRDDKTFEELWGTAVRSPAAALPGSSIRLERRGSVFRVTGAGDCMVSIYDLAGKLVTKLDGSQAMPIFTPRLKTGTYVIRIASRSTSFYRTVTVME